jgi:dinuclear metal center YbgI/SA1388 family protein
MGTFKPGENTKPFVGEKGKIEEVEENRIETIISENQLYEIISVVKENHPYEDVAYDLFPVVLKGKKAGMGRIGYFAKEKKMLEVMQLVKKKLSVSYIKVVGNINNTVKRIAVCGGSGSSLINYAYKKGADLFITGDVKYHEAQMAESLGLNLIDAGHWATEVPIVLYLRDYLTEELKNNQSVEIIISKIKTEPYIYY